VYPFLWATLQRSRAGLYSSDIVQTRDVKLEVSTIISAPRAKLRPFCTAEMTVIKRVKDDMRVYKYFSSLILMAAMAGPVALGATALNSQRDNDDQDHKVHRYYDRQRRDFHEWNEHESRAYARWEAKNHKKHREYVARHRNDQSRYWTWRHHHPDND
jgi:hypothetical protein